MAKYRLGEDHNLAREFVKTNPWPKWRQRFFWALAGILGYNVLGSLARLISDGAGMAAMFLGASGTSLGIVQSAMHLGCWRFCSLFCWFWSCWFSGLENGVRHRGPGY